MNSLRTYCPALAMQPSGDQFWNQAQGQNVIPDHKQTNGDQTMNQPQSQTMGQVNPNQQQQFAQSQFAQQQYGQPQYAQQPIGGVVNQYQPHQMMHSGGKSRIAAGILGLLLGGLGIHNFYLGYTGKAVAQLLITVLSFGLLAFIPAIWGLIEGIMILTDKNYLDGQGFPLEG